MDLAAARLVAVRDASTALCAAAAAGLVTGYVLVERGPIQALAAIAIPVALYAVLRSVWVAYAGVIAILCLLPYAVLPAGTAVTPTLLELALIVALGVTASVVVIDRRQLVPTGGAQSLVLILMGVAVFAFVLGLGRGYTTQTLHDFAKFVLAILSFALTLQLVRTKAEARRLVAILIGGVTSAAIIALALYAGGPSLTERVLARLVPYGYPASRIVRFIEDDPARAMRAVGTSVDPNSFGGLLMIGFVLAGGQLVVRRRSIPPLVALTAAAVCGAAMLLTYSRGAWVGAAAGVGLVLLLRRPILLVPIAGAGAALVVLGVGAGFVERLWLGFTLQDPATKLRLDEYRNAWAIIRQHPVFGVGFGDAPSIELQTGVSSIYLTIAERAGLVGLAVFLIAVSVIGWQGLRASTDGSTERSDIAVCLLGAFAAALVVGLVDHYFFNPQFPHMAALFWLVAGALVAVARSGASPGDERAVCSARRARITAAPADIDHR